MKKALIALLFGLLTIPALADNTIVENLQELIETRDAITNAIVQKGGTVTSGALTNVPNEILSIPSGGGGGTEKLPEIVSKQVSPEWSLEEGDLTGVKIIGRSAFAYSGLTSIAIPNTVTSILQFAFQNCPSLTTINVPDSVMFVDKSAFSGSAVGIVDFGGTRNTIPTYGTLGNQGYPSGCRILVPSSLLDTWKAATGWSGQSTRIAPHIDFDPTLTYGILNNGTIGYMADIVGPITDAVMNDIFNEAALDWEGTDIIVLGTHVTDIIVSSENIGPDAGYQLGFMDRTQSDVTGWTNYPWDYDPSTFRYVNSQTDHTVK